MPPILPALAEERRDRSNGTLHPYEMVTPPTIARTDGEACSGQRTSAVCLASTPRVAQKAWTPSP